ncbi:MAG: hypothetical protein ABI137_07140 [Antricoccus sp.]
MRTRGTFVVLAYAIVVMIAALVVVSWIMDFPALLAWSAAILLMALATVITALRGQTKGQAKRDRDEQRTLAEARTRASTDTGPLPSDQVGF